MTGIASLQEQLPVAMANSQILTVAEMRSAEQALMDGGTDVHQLMQRAGCGAAEWVWRIAAGRGVTVLCGPGNNGGDGYVIAERLRQRGLPVQVIAAMPPATDAAVRARKGFGGDVMSTDSKASGAIFVDCLFGSGLTRELSDELAQLLVRLASSHAYSIAIDVPSGVESDQGKILGPQLEYDLTISLGAWKRAHFLMPAMGLMGILRLVDIGVAKSDASAQLIERPSLAAPAVDSHKYRRGLLAVVGGQMPGAGMLAARAAMYGGAGYVKLFSDHPLASAPDELVLEGGELAIALADGRLNAILAGPGLGREQAAQHRLAEVMRRDAPTVLDADALVLLKPGMLANRCAAFIVTPHEGELARLEASFGIVGAEGKVARAQELARRLGAIVIAKGPDTVVAAPDGRLAMANRASSWLSTAGTGDVLAGIVASRLATGADPFDAACQGVWLHAEAAHIAGVAFTAAELAQEVAHAYSACL